MSSGIVPNSPIRADNFRGLIFPYAGASAPSGFLLCDGSAVSRITYAGLYALIGDTYGAGDGSTTFNLPDCRNRFLMGYSSSAPSRVLTFSSRVSDTITSTGTDNTGNNEIQTGQKVRYTTSGSPISGLTNDTDYYLIRVAYNQFKLALSPENANQGVAITLSSNGSGTQLFTINFSSSRTVGHKGGLEVQPTSARHSHYPSSSTGVGGNIRISSYNATDDNTRTPYTSGFGEAIYSTGEAEPNNVPPFLVVNFIIKT